MSEDNINNPKQGNGNNVAPANNTVELSYSLTRGDLFWYNLYYARFLVIGVIILFPLFVIALIITLNTPAGDLFTTFLWIDLGIGIGLSVCLSAIAAIALQIYVVKSDTISKALTERNYIISSAGVAVFDDKIRITRIWKDIIKVNKSRKRYFIRTGDKLALIIPKRELNKAGILQTFEKILADSYK